jgi:hypothetical protein
VVLNMLDSYQAQRIASSIEQLSREVGNLRDEVSRHREKLGPQPEWLLFMIPTAALVLLVALLIIDAAKKDRPPSSESPRIEAQKLPEKSS